MSVNTEQYMEHQQWHMVSEKNARLHFSSISAGWTITVRMQMSPDIHHILMCVTLKSQAQISSFPISCYLVPQGPFSSDRLPERNVASHLRRHSGAAVDRLERKTGAGARTPPQESTTLSIIALFLFGLGVITEAIHNMPQYGEEAMLIFKMASRITDDRS
ncbi:uncharacterized [Tachysurus ichikawai]